MRLCSFEDARVRYLEPLTLTRPAFALRCGAETLLERQRRALAADEIGGWVRPELAALSRLMAPDVPINEPSWLRERRPLFLNARWLPDAHADFDARTPRVGLVGEQVAYLVLPEPALPPEPEYIGTWLESWKARLPRRDAGGVLFDYLWDIVAHNAAALAQDLTWFRTRAGQRALPTQVSLLGPAERCVLAASAVVEPFVVLDTRQGPVLVDDGAALHSFSRLEGPCYIGKDSWVLGGRVRGGTTIGPKCRVGGDIEESILQKHVNKQHDGFLGHSYVGEWVNLAAGTQTSDLRNDYGEVRVTIAGQRLATGLTKVGSFIGDHTKTGLGVLLNTGSAIGAFANLLPSGTLLPGVVPSFCQVSAGGLQELWDLRKLFGTAGIVMRRRGQELTETHREFYDGLYEATAELRRRAVRDSEARRLRRSV
jgi:UDP-N-acetylglucosamine diphosphorylase / glucose-1-phosphate thymidylyltransferase / UDP-N-acetylgalactosamine diphosphorylase / glucosamine-1-phosphate N-acetyltransferase / galactosamine-1-phosphate N-acetyltransferase